MVLRKTHTIQAQFHSAADQGFRFQVIVFRILAVAVKVDDHNRGIYPGLFPEAGRSCKTCLSYIWRVGVGVNFNPRPCVITQLEVARRGNAEYLFYRRERGGRRDESN